MPVQALDVIQSDYSHNRWAMVHRLLLAGRQEALDFVLKQFESPKAHSQTSGSYQGKDVVRQTTLADDAAGHIAEMRSERYIFEILAPEDERSQERTKLKKWIVEQFDLIRQGKPSGLSSKPAGLSSPLWRLDAPG